MKMDLKIKILLFVIGAPLLFMDIFYSFDFDTIQDIYENVVYRAYKISYLLLMNTRGRKKFDLKRRYKAFMWI